MRFERGIEFWAGALACAVALTSSGCADRSTPGERVVARSSVVASALPSHARTGASVEERFGLPRETRSPDDGVGEAASMLRWNLPKGWVERAPSAMRIANFLAAGDPNAECYLTILAADAGGLGANVNRWLAQMGHPAMGPAQIDALPRASLFGRDAVLLEVDGDFTGMSGGAAMSGGATKIEHRLLGLLLVDPNGSAFLKLVGPSGLVARERASFLELAASMRSATDPRPSGTKSSETQPTTRIERAAGLTVRVPSDWMRLQAKPPRALDLRIDAQLECSITVLAGEAGGARANIDRWRSQLGLTPLDDTQYSGLERIPMQGGSALLVEASTSAEAVLGAVRVGSDRSIFVKLTGPVGRIAQHRAQFLELCRTLEGD